MNDRIDKEIELLKKFYRDLQVSPDKKWVLIPDYIIPRGFGWNKESIPLVVQFLDGFPGTPPYGFYVPSDILNNNEVPESFQQKANNVPYFPGEWAMFSWQLEEGWFASADLESGSNMAMFVRSIIERFKQGK